MLLLRFEFRSFFFVESDDMQYLRIRKNIFSLCCVPSASSIVQFIDFIALNLELIQNIAHEAE